MECLKGYRMNIFRKIRPTIIIKGEGHHLGTNHLLMQTVAAAYNNLLLRLFQHTSIDL